MQHPHTLPVNDRFEVRINQFLPAKDNHLFNEQAYFRLHTSSPGDIYAQLARRSDGEVHATIACYEGDSREYYSPKRGTYGGISAQRGLDLSVLERFLIAITDYLRARGATILHIKDPPFSHDLQLSSIAANILMRARATMSGFELNYDLEVDARPFHARIDAGSRKRIRKCKEAGFEAMQIAPDAGRLVYELIRANRMRRGVPITMSAAQLDEMARTFPDRVHYFAVFTDATRSSMVAAAVCISISAEVLYVFYWGDSDEMQSHSPVVLLAENIYGFAQKEGFRVLDAGISTSANEPNLGLIAFKRGLGFTESLKPTYMIPLQP